MIEILSHVCMKIYSKSLGPTSAAIRGIRFFPVGRGGGFRAPLGFFHLCSENPIFEFLGAFREGVRPPLHPNSMYGPANHLCHEDISSLNYS